MRKISQEASQALYNGASYHNSNTRVEDGKLYLHGNRIAMIKDNRLFIDSCGWNSNTTRERLNALRGVTVRTKQGQMFLNGKEWDGNLIEVIN